MACRVVRASVGVRDINGCFCRKQLVALIGISFPTPKTAAIVPPIPICVNVTTILIHCRNTAMSLINGLTGRGIEARKVAPPLNRALGLVLARGSPARSCEGRDGQQAGVNALRKRAPLQKVEAGWCAASAALCRAPLRRLESNCSDVCGRKKEVAKGIGKAAGEWHCSLRER